MRDKAQVVIAVAESADDIAGARELFREYADWLGFSLSFQDFENELATMPGKYTPPEGRLLLARCAGELAGCGALRPLEPGVCEMKRVYVRPGFRGLGIGRELVERLIAAGRQIGYRTIRLDTIPAKMSDAHRMYLALGFQSIPPYYPDNPQPGVCYLELSLR